MIDSLAGDRNPVPAIIPVIDEALGPLLYSAIRYQRSLLHSSKVALGESGKGLTGGDRCARIRSALSQSFDVSGARLALRLRVDIVAKVPNCPALISYCKKIRPTTADRCGLNRVTEVASEFIFRTSLHESRVYSQKKFRSRVQKDFCNKICHKLTHAVQ
jgi:hypothetical protein